MDVSALFADIPTIHFDGVEVMETALHISAHTTLLPVDCPVCHTATRHVHSRYVRRIAELPCLERAVRFTLRVRRFFCINPACPRVIFTERLPDLVAPSARRTTRYTERLRRLAFALACEHGARLAPALGLATSADTLLRLIDATPVPHRPTPRFLGVDDWAMRKGHTYGTVLIDLETRQSVDLLPNRTADTFATWLKEHPGVAVISRDRAGAYAEGGRRGAPEAVQVADRFHLCLNATTALQAVVHRRLPHVALPTKPAPSDVPDVASGTCHMQSRADPIVALPPRRTTHQARTQKQSEERRARRVAQYTDVRTLHAQGMTNVKISTTLHLHRDTVARYLRADTFPEIAARTPRPSKLDPFTAYIQKRWGEGCHGALLLLREIQQQGYTGGRTLVYDYLRAQWPLSDAARVPKPAKPPLSVRQATWALWAPEAKVTDELRDLRQTLENADTTLRDAARLTRHFLDVLRKKQRNEWGIWLDAVAEYAIPELVSFKSGLLRDEKAVILAIESETSNGQTEGQVNRIKMLKRVMFGRASFDLLRRRVLYTS